MIKSFGKEHGSLLCIGLMDIIQLSNSSQRPLLIKKKIYKSHPVMIGQTETKLSFPELVGNHVVGCAYIPILLLGYKRK